MLVFAIVTLFHLTLHPKRNCPFFFFFFFVEGLSDGMVKVYLSAVYHAQIGLGLGDPRISDMPHLGYVVKGFRRRFPSLSSGRPQLPITPAILRTFLNVV